MSDLSKLRPEVREAVQYLDEGLGDDDPVWFVVRAELLRLAEVEARYTNPGTTHAPGCGDWGPKHYECLLRERDNLRTELGRAYRALAAYAHANAKGEPLSDAAVAYHSLTEAAAKRFVNHGALDGSEYFISKHVDVLHAALRGE